MATTQDRFKGAIDTTADAAKAATDRAANAANGAKKEGTGIVDTVKDTARSVADQVADTASTVRDKAESVAGDAYGAAKDAGHKVQEWAGEARDVVGDNMSHFGNEVTTLVRKHPIPSLLIGFGIGLLIGRTARMV